MNLAKTRYDDRDPLDENVKSTILKQTTRKPKNEVPQLKIPPLNEEIEEDFSTLQEKIARGDYDPHKQMVWPGRKAPREPRVDTENRVNFRKLDKELETKFIQDLFAEYHVQDNPKRSLLLLKARCHVDDNGYEALRRVFEDLVPLIRLVQPEPLEPLRRVPSENEGALLRRFKGAFERDELTANAQKDHRMKSRSYRVAKIGGSASMRY